MAQCAFLERCGFFNKYCGSLNMACRGFIRQYCEAGREDACKRADYRRRNGQPPSDDMLPTGQMITEGLAATLSGKAPRGRAD